MVFWDPDPYPFEFDPDPAQLLLGSKVEVGRMRENGEGVRVERGKVR